MCVWQQGEELWWQYMEVFENLCMKPTDKEKQGE